MSPVIAKMSFQRWLGIVLVVLSVASIILVAVQTARLNNATACQANYNVAYTRSIQQRAAAARDERQAQRQLLVTLLSGPTTPEQRRAAFADYLASLDKADQQREAAAIPNRRC
jgi:hypothetical protein